MSVHSHIADRCFIKGSKPREMCLELLMQHYARIFYIASNTNPHTSLVTRGYCFSAIIYREPCDNVFKR